MAKPKCLSTKIKIRFTTTLQWHPDWALWVLLLAILLALTHQRNLNVHLIF